MTYFYDQLLIIRVLGAVVILGLTLLLCRYGGRAVEAEEEFDDEENESGEWERYEAEDTGREYYERKFDY